MKAESYIWGSLKTIKKEPCPKGMNSREIVRRAIEFDNPPRIPYYFLFHPSAADLTVIGMLSAASSRRTNLPPGATYVDDWGVTWEVTGRWWDKASAHPLTDLAKARDYKFPDYSAAIQQVKPLMNLGRWAGKYVLTLNPVNMYETMRSLVGFEELMMAPYTQPDGLRDLLERLTVMTIDSLNLFADMGADGFLTLDDWGLQNRLQMKIATFREFYKPYYKRIVDACHARGMHLFWHNCGYIVDMFPDMIEMGVDVLQLDQPRLMGHETLIEHLGGKVCMWNTVDIQWSTSEGVTDEQICQEAETMIRVYDSAGRGGGFIAKHYPQPWDINLPPERQQLIARTFMKNKAAQLRARPSA